MLKHFYRHKICCYVLPKRNKYYRTWRTPGSLRDEQNLGRSLPDTREQWLQESTSDGKSREDIFRDISRLPKKLKSRMSHCRTFLPIENVHETSLGYQRKVFANYGKMSDIDASVYWPTKTDIKLELEKESLFVPNIPTMLDNVQKTKEKEQLAIEQRMAKISKKMEKMPHLIAQFNERQKKLEEDVNQWREKRQALLEEARDYFGYYVRPSDDKFQKLKELKEEEEKLRKKAERKSRRQSMLT